jgi:hypothetical protein
MGASMPGRLRSHARAICAGAAAECPRLLLGHGQVQDAPQQPVGILRLVETGCARKGDAVGARDRGDCSSAASRLLRAALAPAAQHGGRSRIA